ncbi:unnamed protein product [Agarophyton chilense]|eukprot:gb/GEZJ01001514.1/.p1 GENE.gb/GEZJ01001514.1/~~gb/GEZJ01001514.1/.p1  ORF type:complete len:537 (-),score=85.36 gb/GEZJ01001514.1/:1043-2653(-)
MAQRLPLLRWSRALSQTKCVTLYRNFLCSYSTKSSESCENTNIFDARNSLTEEAERLLKEDTMTISENAQRVLEILKTAVSQNSPRAKTLLGSLFREGIIVEKNRDEALRLFNEAAEQGDPTAQCSLGAFKLQVVKEKMVEGMHDTVKHTDFTVDINERGEARGMLHVESKGGGPVDAATPAELVRRVRKARRKAGFTDEQAREFEEFKIRKEEEAMAAERQDAISWLERAVQQDNVEAFVILGNEILQEDPKRAIDLYEAAVQRGRNVDAYYNLGQIYTRGLGSVAPNAKAALKNFAMAAQLGDSSAQFYLGHLYKVGSEEIKLDLASARQYIEMAAAQDHPGALYNLALMHKDGEGGLEISHGAFLRYVNQAANLDHGPAHVCLAELYYTGSNGIDVDYKKALYHFLAAGRLGEAEAYCSAAAMHFHGFGTDEDQHQAFLLYQKAAEFGSTKAFRNIGSMYFHGHGIPSNKNVAEHFFRVADERESASRKSDEVHLQKPVASTEAPKHPMADVPRPNKESRDSELVTPDPSVPI